MPDVKQNVDVWNGTYDWAQQGEEWSACWGGAARQWHGAILPRILPFVPAATILEIAPGFGRWTQFLLPQCDRLIAVDLSEKCIAACRQRFIGETKLTCYVNDGSSLAMVPDGSIDFAFSFDSLVHVEWDVLSAYIEQLATKLTPQGVAFFHHSNLGAYTDDETHALLPGVDNKHWRSTSVSAELVRDATARIGLSCISQELLNWGEPEDLHDAFTVIARPASRWNNGRTAIVENHDFMREAEQIRVFTTAAKTQP
jgi:Methyltransferase domain